MARAAHEPLGRLVAAFPQRFCEHLRPAGLDGLEHSLGRGALLPNVKQRKVKVEHLRRVRPGLAQEFGSLATVHSFSIFTRNALNSGVRALASPTNGVSALASQCCPVLIPTNPQWIGIPI